jgi:hypothetical protein
LSRDTPKAAQYVKIARAASQAHLYVCTSIKPALRMAFRSTWLVAGASVSLSVDGHILTRVSWLIRIA